MLQTIYCVPHEIFGIPVFGFGLLFAVWVLGGLGWVFWLGRRQGFNADTWAYVPLIVLVGAVICWLLPVLCEARGLPIRGYGVMVVLGIAAGTALSAWRARRVGIDPDLIISLAFWMFVPGIIAARAFYVIEYWPQQYWPVYQERGLSAFLGAVINLSQGGLVVYGSFLGAMLGVLGFVRQYRVPLLALCDLIAPGIVLGLALGRIGCLMNGCCYGGLCDLPWAVTFPCDSPVHFHQVEHGQTYIYGLKITEDAEGRPTIAEVEPGSAAQRQGLKPKQQIIRINGRPVSTIRGATAVLLSANKISIATEGNPYVGQWRIDTRQSESRSDRDLQYIRDVEQGRAFIHGLKIVGNAEGQPVIAEVEPGSPAQCNRLKPKHRITAIDSRRVDTVADAVATLLDAQRISIATRETGHVARWRIGEALSKGLPVLPVHPTQVYSSINALLLCLLLLAYEPFCRRDGQLFALLLLLYTISRFLLEIIRTDESAVGGTALSISQNVSAVLLVFTVGLWFYILRRPPGKAFEALPT